MSRIKTIYASKYLCKYGQTHNCIPWKEFTDVAYELCKTCGKKFRWVKGKGGKIDNRKYLKVHQRDFAQRMGRTKKLFEYLYVNPYKKSSRIGAEAIADRRRTER